MVMMLDPTPIRRKARSNYVLRGWTLNFTALCVFSIGGAVYAGLLSNEEAKVALKERVVVGNVVEVLRGRSDPINY